MAAGQRPSVQARWGLPADAPYVPVPLSLLHICQHHQLPGSYLYVLVALLDRWRHSQGTVVRISLKEITALVPLSRTAVWKILAALHAGKLITVVAVQGKGQEIDLAPLLSTASEHHASVHLGKQLFGPQLFTGGTEVFTPGNSTVHSRHGSVHSSSLGAPPPIEGKKLETQTRATQGASTSSLNGHGHGSNGTSTATPPAVPLTACDRAIFEALFKAQAPRPVTQDGKFSTKRDREKYERLTALRDDPDKAREWIDHETGSHVKLVREIRLTFAMSANDRQQNGRPKPAR